MWIVHFGIVDSTVALVVLTVKYKYIAYVYYNRWSEKGPKFMWVLDSICIKYILKWKTYWFTFIYKLISFLFYSLFLLFFSFFLLFPFSHLIYYRKWCAKWKCHSIKIWYDYTENAILLWAIIGHQHASH